MLTRTAHQCEPGLASVWPPTVSREPGRRHTPDRTHREDTVRYRHDDCYPDYCSARSMRPRSSPNATDFDTKHWWGRRSFVRHTRDPTVIYWGTRRRDVPFRRVLTRSRDPARRTVRRVHLAHRYLYNSQSQHRYSCSAVPKFAPNWRRS